MSYKWMYPSVYGNRNCAIYDSLLSIKPLAYAVVEFEKQKNIKVILLISPESILQNIYRKWIKIF